MKLTDLFYLPRSDRRALWTIMIILIVCLGILWRLQYVSFPEKKAPLWSYKPQYKNFTHYSKRSETLAENTINPQGKLFVFDPNTATATQLQALGLQLWQIKILFRYRERGGFFSKPTDFARLYGLTQGQYKRLEPYIVISNNYKPASLLIQEENTTKAEGTSYSPKIKVGEHINLNMADTTALKCVPSIGSYYSKEIVRYRKDLGGYYSVDQLKEIEGFPLSALSFFSVDPSAIKKVHINTLSL